MTPEKLLIVGNFTGMYPNNIRKVVSLSQDVVAKLNNGAEKTGGKGRKANNNESEENDTLSTNDSDDDEVVSANMTNRNNQEITKGTWRDEKENR